MTSCSYGHCDAAYVLGALSPAERTAYEHHLATCPACVAAVAHLAPLPGLLSRVDPVALRRSEAAPELAAVEAGPEPAGSLGRLLQAGADQRRRWLRRRRWRLAAALAGVVLLAIAGSAALLGLSSDQPQAPPPAAREQMQPVVAEAPVTAEVALTETAAGTVVWMRCGYPGAAEGPPGVFRLVAVGADGSREQVGSWLAGPGDEVTMTGVTRYVGDELAGLELRGYDDAHLLSYEPG